MLLSFERGIAMNRHRFPRLVLFSALGFALAALSCGGADPKDKPPSKETTESPEKAAEMQAEDVSNIVLAYQFADAGRKYNLPEALVTAGGLFLKAAAL